MVAVGASDKCLAKLNGNTWSVSIASKSWSGSLTQHHQKDLLSKGMDYMSEITGKQLTNFIEATVNAGAELHFSANESRALLEFIVGLQAVESKSHVAEIVRFGGDGKECAWRKGVMPPIGSKLYISPQVMSDELPAMWDRSDLIGGETDSCLA